VNAVDLATRARRRRGPLRHTGRLRALSPSPPVSEASPRNRWAILRKVAVGIYALICVASLVWALPGRGTQNALGAVIQVGQTSEGTVYVTVRNEGRIAWNDVRVVVDDRYFLRRAAMEPGEGMDARIREFEHVYRLLRPPGLYLWDDPTLHAPPLRWAPTGYRPSRVSLSTHLGVVEETFARD
jgi:hypothetical protein